LRKIIDEDVTPSGKYSIADLIVIRGEAGTETAFEAAPSPTPALTVISHLVEMGVLPQEIEAKISSGAWKTACPDTIEDGERRILLSSLPLDLQTK
jgi:hypothetical protein